MDSSDSCNAYPVLTILTAAAWLLAAALFYLDCINGPKETMPYISICSTLLLCQFVMMELGAAVEITRARTVDVNA